VVLRPVAIGGSATGVRLQLRPATGTPLLLSPTDTATVTASGSAVRVAVQRGSGSLVQRSSSGWTAEWTGTKALAGPASRVAVSSSIIGTSGRKVRSYRWGRLALSSLGGAVEVVTSVDLHSGYLRGLAEMPSSWPPAALQAQVITARSYALVEAAKAPRAPCGGCQVWDDQRSQVYVGWAKEGEGHGTSNVGARWVAAVTATSPSSTTGLAVLHQGRPVQTFYSSSTGGRTRDAQLVWGTSLPYLHSVPDPWSVDPDVNPKYASWRRTISVASLLSGFKITDGSGLASVRVTTKDSSGAAAVITARSAAGAVRTMRGDTFRSRFGLPSAWIGTVTLPAPPT
jgi:SpoIID/LytB domain protein